MLDEHTRECLAIEFGRWIRSQDVILTLSRLVKLYGKPQYLRSDNGAELTASAVMRWLQDQNVGPALIALSRPSQNGYFEIFHGKLRNERLNREWFHDARVACVIIARWRDFCSHLRLQSVLDYRRPAQSQQAGPELVSIDVLRIA